MKGNRLVIPEVLRTDILRYLHDAHQGVSKSREHAKNSVWWPGLSRDIEKVVRNCNLCEKYRRDRIEPMRGTEFPKRPWSRIGADFFYYKGNNYLLAFDYYSRDIEICIVTKNVDTAETVLKMRKIFCRHGICDVLFSDNGPQFDSRLFKEFAKEWNFEHITSSPKYSQSNGETETAVQTMKAILNKCDDEYLALLTYRNTPLHNGYSPSQLSMGRKLKTRVPCHPDELIPKVPEYSKLCQREREYRSKMTNDYNRRHRVVQGDDLSPGDRVWIPDLRTEGRVLSRHFAPKSVLIETPKGTVRRNRRMTRRMLGDTRDAEDVFEPTHISSREEDENHNSSRDNNVHPTQPSVRRSNRIRRSARRYIEEM
uniref:uncharacterized protein K02A2.6-like n=1 Tax=Styela clava TaxID=7725 RepID=UPI00193A5663|nr:uncharacterized protein K02A2.6-like [Styela clava]